MLNEQGTQLQAPDAIEIARRPMHLQELLERRGAVIGVQGEVVAELFDPVLIFLSKALYPSLGVLVEGRDFRS